MNEGKKDIFKWAEIFQDKISYGASRSDIIQLLEDYTMWYEDLKTASSKEDK